MSGSHDNKKQGIADSHIYSVIAARKGVCGQFDLICFRNPWGRGEFEGGGWNDGGTMWDAYPEAYEELQYAADPDDGLFWMEWTEACNYFWSFNVCKVETAGKREPTPISEEKREQRAIQKQASGFDLVVQAVREEFFDPLDTQGDGILSVDDVNEALQKLAVLGEEKGYTDMQAKCDKLRANMDESGDGQVTWPDMWDAMVEMILGDPEADPEDLRAMFEEQVAMMGEESATEQTEQLIQFVKDANPYSRNIEGDSDNENDSDDG